LEVETKRGGRRESSLANLLVLGVAAGAALLSAHGYAGGWNDGSRLATVECLVDYHTLAIDRSIFVQPPIHSLPIYPADDPALLRDGTGDKLLIHGQFYSDKSPVPALLMAGLYYLFEWTTSWTAQGRPDVFCYCMAISTSGLAYVIAVWCIYQLGSVLWLPVRLAVTGSFAFATTALTYARYVNNHILLLGVVAVLLLGVCRLAKEESARKCLNWRLLGLGGLAGLAYAIDLGAGPVFLLCTAALIAYRLGRPLPIIVFLAGAAPWLILHHTVNFAVGGTFKPANAVAAYFDWPGCTFNTQNMTGTWNHANIGHFLVYAAALLFGKRGFIGHNLALYLTFPAIVALLHKKRAEFPELIFAGCCCGGVWLAYALTSNNSSGCCCSIRWFVPLLAPAYYVLLLYLREYPRQLRNFLVLSAWGVVLAVLMWHAGPWTKQLIPFFWPIQAGALVTILLASRFYRPATRSVPSLAPAYPSPHSLVNADSLSRPLA
jgi:hypothetical protein